MEIALFLVALVVTVLAGTALAARLDLPAPLLLIAAGVAATWVPHVPEVHLEPEIVLLGLLPPLLYAAALQTSLVEFNANRRAIGLLSVGLVVFTTAGVAVVVHALVPGLSWPAAFAIGAVVAPPDAVAATAIGKRIGLPRRVVTILEGESLLNDATALVSLRTAIAAGSVGVEALDVGLDFLWASAGGAGLGFLAFVIVAKLRHLVSDPVLDTAISLVTPFAAYLLAEELHSSGVVAVVVAGLLLGHKAPVIQTAQSRIAERINWSTIAFLLENTVFLLIGLQARWIVEDVGDSELTGGRIALVCAAALVAVVVLRLVWVFFARYALVRPGVDPATGEVPPWQYTLLLGWAGMRGVVTLAAAFVIPEETEHREVLLLIAFTVVAGTLFAQGLTLPWLARTLRVPSPDPVEDALARATLLQQASRAGFEELERLEYDDPHGVFDLVHQRVEQRNFAAWEQLSTSADDETPSELYARIRKAMIDAERARVLEVRSARTVPSEVVRDVLATLDVEESMLDAVPTRRKDSRAAAGTRRRSGDSCEHLADAPALPVSDDVPECTACVALGSRWVAVRRCLECGNLGCCDSSPHRHATAHFQESHHPVFQSAMPGEDWRWCYVDHVTG
ncbi:Na+/H+ antiporter [Nocardioides gansuensis]|uniref:Na+/H+ antiporter n=1 Tax=Nocardioides gansuensis TaxID=2138300 RepID=A0A2T8FA22_9ACTN|nr:Na+/H+ antiporter [Nocardioides gansuensis]PVG82517.1 Na+/H+ antiporter [Nocardioides gansuensis]